MDNEFIQQNRAKRGSVSNFHTNCLNCGVVKYYSTQGNLNFALSKNRNICNTCKKQGKLLNCKRICPSCGIEINYKYSITYKRQSAINSSCKKCALQKNNCSPDKKILPEGPYIRFCPSCNKVLLVEEFRKIKKLKDCLCLSCSISKKNRIRHKNDREKFGQIIVPSVNRNACFYFDQLNILNGWNLQHGLNGGEFYVEKLGYWLDAYDKKRNIVVEYDEPRHYEKDGSLKSTDVVRMKEICNKLQCEFWRFNEIKKELIKYEY